MMLRKVLILSASAGAGHLRLSYAGARADVELALERLRAWVGTLAATV